MRGGQIDGDRPAAALCLGRRLCLDSGTLTPLCKRLEAAGLVVRERDPDDQRRLLVGLTTLGAALRARAAAIPWTVLCQLPFGPEEAVNLKAMLTRLTEGLSKVTPEDGAA